MQLRAGRSINAALGLAHARTHRGLAPADIPFVWVEAKPPTRATLQRGHATRSAHGCHTVVTRSAHARHPAKATNRIPHTTCRIPHTTYATQRNATQRNATTRTWRRNDSCAGSSAVARPLQRADEGGGLYQYLIYLKKNRQRNGCTGVAGRRKRGRKRRRRRQGRRLAWWHGPKPARLLDDSLPVVRVDV